MAISATCPECSASAAMPDEMAGKKVRCKKCQEIFTVPAASGKAKRPASRTALSGSGGMQRPAKKSSLLLWVCVGLISVIALGGVGAGVWFTVLKDESPQQAKAKNPKTTPVAEKTPKEQVDPKPPKTKENKGGPIAKGPGAKTPPEGKKPPEQAPGETKEIEPVVVSALAASSPVELPDLAAIKGVYTVGNDLNRLGLHAVSGKDHYFEMYDLKKEIRVSRFKIPNDVEFIDVDPDGTIVATSSFDKRFNAYSLPDGGLVEDDTNLYDNIQDKIHYLSELGGKINYIAMLSKNELFAMSNIGLGDVWSMPSKKNSLVLMQPLPRTTFRKETVEPNRDFVLSPDRALLAYACDDGIVFLKARTGDRVGATAKLTKYGTKPEVAAMGFDPQGKKLTVYLSAANDKGRGFLKTAYSVPDGAQLSQEETTDPGLLGVMAFVNDVHFFSFERNSAILRDGQGKTVAEGRIPAKASLFAPNVVHANVAYTFLTNKNKPAIGLASVPLGGAVSAPPPPMPMPTTETKGKSALELFAPPTPTTPPPGEKTKERVFEQQEIWEFGAQGIMKKGIKSFEVRAAK